MIHKPLSFLHILFTITVFFNLATFGHSRPTNLGHHIPKNVKDQTTITTVEPPYGSSNGGRANGMTKDDKEEAVLLNELNDQGSYGSSYGYGYDNPYPGGIFGWPRGLFRFPRGLFGLPLGFFGHPGGYDGYGGSRGGYDGYGGSQGGYGGSQGGYDGYMGGYGGGQTGDKPGGGGYVGAAEVKGK